MVRFLYVVLLVLWPGIAATQTRVVGPDELGLTVTLEDIGATPFQREMVLLTIHGVYKRHITLEKLEQPDLAGLNWMQLGEDQWFESMVDGKTVKNMRRRMALFPDVAGEIEIGSFIHHLTLLDENDDRFEHEIRSEPIALQVDPVPALEGWWFPVRNLKISDNWSNEPDQLAKGEGVLRIMRVTALGASPDMIPPMPELTSPSALIFAHPEKRLVDLTPRGPVAIAFWRWTIQPKNGVSAILEPIEFSYFDTVQRKTIDVSISAQRIAYLRSEPVRSQPAPVAEPSTGHPRLLLVTFLVSLGVALAVLVDRARTFGGGVIAGWWHRRRLLRDLHRSSVLGDVSGVRRAARALDAGAHADARRVQLLRDLEGHIYSASLPEFDLTGFAQRFRKALKRVNT